MSAKLLLFMTPDNTDNIQDIIEEAKRQCGKYWMRYLRWPLIRKTCVEKKLKLMATKIYQEKIAKKILWRRHAPIPPLSNGQRFIHFWQTVATHGARWWMNGSAS